MVSVLAKPVHNRAVEPEPKQFWMDGAKAGVWNLGSVSTALILWASEMYK